MLGGETQGGKCPGSKGEVEGRGEEIYRLVKGVHGDGAWVRDERRRGQASNVKYRRKGNGKVGEGERL